MLQASKQYLANLHNPHPFKYIHGMCRNHVITVAPLQVAEWGTSKEYLYLRTNLHIKLINPWNVVYWIFYNMLSLFSVPSWWITLLQASLQTFFSEDHMCTLTLAPAWELWNHRNATQWLLTLVSLWDIDMLEAPINNAPHPFRQVFKHPVTCSYWSFILNINSDG